MKRCPTCGETKPIAEFYAAPERDDGLAGRCIPCALAADVASVLKLKLRVIAHLGGQCVECGYNTFGPALQIDHVNGDGAAERKKNASPRRILHAVLEDTASRYQLMCANCNQVKRMEDGEHKGSRVYLRSIIDDGRTKYCAKCACTKTVAEFYGNRARRDGLSVYCGACHLAFTREEERRQRNVAVDHLGGCCVECGYGTDRRALQFDHVNGGGRAERDRGTRGRALYKAVMTDDVGRYQLLCSNCNVLKKISAKEFRSRDTYVRNPATERRPTRQYLSPDQIAELVRLVLDGEMLQKEAGELFGITQSVVSVHIKNHRLGCKGRAAQRALTDGRAA